VLKIILLSVLIAKFKVLIGETRCMTYSRRMVFPALIAAGILWGTTVPLSKIALGWMAPGWLAFARFALAAVVLMAVSRFRLRAVCSPAILLSGAAGYGGSVLLQNLGIQRTSVTHAALLIGATPVLVALLAAVLGHSVARPLAWAGFGLSLLGVGFIAAGQGGGSTLGGDGLVLASQLASAGFTVSQARLLRGKDPVAVTAVQLMAAAAAMLPLALVSERHAMAGSVSLSAVLAVTGLVLAGTVLPMALFAFGQSRVSADVAGAFLNLEPLVGAIVGTVLFANPVGPVQLAGGTAILLGIGLSSLQVARGERQRQVAILAPARTAAPAAGRPVAEAIPAQVRRLELPHARIGGPAHGRRTMRRAARRLAAVTRPHRGGRPRRQNPAGRDNRSRRGIRSETDRRPDRDIPPGRPGVRRAGRTSAGTAAARRP
jgi:O-acetylserine/cysteine efflux transporter